MDEIEKKARELLAAMLAAPYGHNCTVGHVVCAETTRGRLEAAWLPLLTAALRSAQVPEGWVLVPREATEAMVEAAWESDATCYVGEHRRIVSASLAYTAMLAAAPSAEGA